MSETVGSAVGPHSDPGQSVESETDPHLKIENRPPFPIDPTVFTKPESDLPRSPSEAFDPIESVERDAWVRIREGISLPLPMHPRVVREIEWYSKNKEYFRRTAQRARPYLAYIVRQVERKELPSEFALLPFVESAFQPYAYSSAGASGLWQFIPSTGRLYGLKQNWWYDGRRDVVASTRAALDYLAKLLQDFDGDHLLAVAAYNWGEGNVMRAMSRNRSRGKPTDVWSLRLPRETRAHVSRLLAISAIVADPARYGVDLEPIPDRVQFRQIPLDGQIELDLAAELAGITLDEIYLLNPGFNRWATDPGGPHRLLLPRNAAEQFKSRLAAIPGRTRVRWAHHSIVSGDTLSAIAARYRTSVSVLMRLNGLTSDRILAGRHLRVPASVAETRLTDATTARLHGASSPGSLKSFHTVRRGDSLWRISRLHGVGYKQLAAWNNLPVNSVLRPGQRLAVYRNGARNGRTVPSTPATSPVKPTTFPVIHVVKRGDTLSGIAQRHGTTILNLTEFNRIEENAVIRPGQKLRLTPVSSSITPSTAPDQDGHAKIRYRVKRGDSLWEISRQFGVSVASLREWNQLTKGVVLMPGWELDVHLKRSPAI